MWTSIRNVKLFIKMRLNKMFITVVCVIFLTTQDPYIQKEHTELYKILKFRVKGP